MSELIRTNCPRDCYDGCGIVVEQPRQAGDPLRVLGDPEHPVSRGRLCSKCAVAYNGVWQDESARLQTPLRRTGAKGEAKFEPISWDEALQTVADAFKSAISERGAESILHTHYSGTLSMLAYMFPNRFFSHMGASEVDPDSICNAAGHTAWHLLYGNSGMGFDPRTAKDASCILVWGANPSHTAPHAHEHWLPESSAQVVVVDPVRTATAEAADLHLQPRPGSDAALAFGLLHVLQREGAFDTGFIDAHVQGADEIQADIERCTPAWAEQQTGVAAADIERAAKLYAAGPALLWCGQGLQRQPTGGNVMRAVGMLPALTGNVGKPGAGFYYLNYTPAFIGMDLAGLSGAGLGSAELRAKRKSVSHMQLAERLVNADEFRAFVAWNTNPVASAADQNALRRALAREDLFTLVIDCFATDTASYADIVLPAASFLEFDDLTYSYFHLLIGAQCKAREPVGQSLPNQEIFRRLASAMGYSEPALHASDATLIDRLLEESGSGTSFEQLRRDGHFYISDSPLQLWESLEFATPSGRIELASDRAVKWGLPRTAQPWVDAPLAGGELRLISPASKWRMNDSYGNDSHLQAQAGPAEVIVHPDDAGRYSVTDGSVVRLSNEAGALELQARVAAIAPAGTLVTYKGRWPGLEATGANVNVLHTARAADMAESTAVHGLGVRLTVVG